jgi:hypothetical protein
MAPMALGVTEMGESEGSLHHAHPSKSNLRLISGNIRKPTVLSVRPIRYNSVQRRLSKTCLTYSNLFEVRPEGRLWRGAVNGRTTASSKLAELSAKSGKPVFAMNLQTREILGFVYPDKQASSAER